MQLSYRGFTHDVSDPFISIERESLMTENQIVYAVLHRWTIRGRLHATNQDTLHALIIQMEDAYKVNGGDLILSLDSGSEAHSIRSAETVGGVKIIRPPSYPEGGGGEYSTFRNYTLVAEAVYPYSQDGVLISWQESITFVGTTGPLWVAVPLLYGPPQIQRLRNYTPVTVIQSGAAIMMYDYPVPPPPLWPGLEHEDRHTVTPQLFPDNSGRRGVQWTYYFTSITPLAALPTISTIN